MAIGSKEMQKTKGISIDIHKEALYQYIVLGDTQEGIASNLGLNSGWEVSSIVRAYNFNKRRGESSGAYRGLARGLVDEFVDLYYPGFVDDESVSLDDFLREYERPREETPPSHSNNSQETRSQVRTTQSQADSQAYGEREYDGGPSFQDTGHPPYREVRENRQHRGGSDSTLSGKIGLLAMLVFTLLYVSSKVLLPALDLGFYSITTFFQKEADIQQGQTKDKEYMGELGLFKKPKGYGLLALEDSKVHIGKFKNGKRQGEGTEILADGRVAYMGNFQNNNYDKFGMIDNGDNLYIGEISKGKKHGKGAIIEDLDETITITEYKNDKLVKEHAIINYVAWEGRLNPDGDYEVFRFDDNNLLVGHKKESGFTVDLSRGYAYFGIYQRGKAKGYGIGITGEGNIEYGRKQGQQTRDAILYIEGEGVSLGNFKKQTKEGYGMEYMLSGDLYIGNYKKSHRHGKGTYMFSDGTSRKVRYKNGNLVD